MDIKGFYKNNIANRKNNCIAYSGFEITENASAGIKQLRSCIEKMCTAANKYIAANQGTTNAEENARTAYGRDFDDDYEGCFQTVRPPKERFGSESESSDTDNITVAPAKTKTKKSKKYYKPKITYVTAEDEKPHKHSTVRVPTETDLSTQIRRSNRNVYYHIDTGQTNSNNLRLLLFADGLSGSSVDMRAAALKHASLLARLRAYFDKHFGAVTMSGLDRYYTEQKDTPGVFFVAPVPKSKQAELIAKMKKMCVPSKNPNPGNDTSTINVPKATKK